MEEISDFMNICTVDKTLRTEDDLDFDFFDNIDDAIIEGLDQNQDFFSLLLNNDEMKRQVLGIFADEIYRS